MATPQMIRRELPGTALRAGMVLELADGMGTRIIRTRDGMSGGKHFRDVTTDDGNTIRAWEAWRYAAAWVAEESLPKYDQEVTP